PPFLPPAQAWPGEEVSRPFSATPPFTDPVEAAMSVPLGNLVLTDDFASKFEVSSDFTWRGLDNARNAPSFICYNLGAAPVYLGNWTAHPATLSVTFHGPGGIPLVTFHGLNPSFHALQEGVLSGWHCPPVPDRWKFVPLP